MLENHSLFSCLSCFKGHQKTTKKTDTNKTPLLEEKFTPSPPTIPYIWIKAPKQTLTQTDPDSPRMTPPGSYREETKWVSERERQGNLSSSYHQPLNNGKR